MWIKKRDWQEFNERYREMQQDYWWSHSENASLRIDIENLERKVQLLEDQLSGKAVGGRVR